MAYAWLGAFCDPRFMCEACNQNPATVAVIVEQLDGFGSIVASQTFGRCWWPTCLRNVPDGEITEEPMTRATAEAITGRRFRLRTRRSTQRSTQPGAAA